MTIWMWKNERTVFTQLKLFLVEGASTFPTSIGHYLSHLVRVGSVLIPRDPCVGGGFQHTLDELSLCPCLVMAVQLDQVSFPQHIRPVQSVKDGGETVSKLRPKTRFENRKSGCVFLIFPSRPKRVIMKLLLYY